MRCSSVFPRLLLGLALGACSQKTTESTGSAAPAANAAVPATDAPADDVTDSATAAPDPAQLTGTWLVQTLNGQAVPAATGARAAQLVFDGAQNRVAGSTGCNRLAGSYTVGGNIIRFGPVTTTRMACVGPNVEPQLLAVLNAQDLTYQLSADRSQLTLLSGAAAVAGFQRASTAGRSNNDAPPGATPSGDNSRTALDWVGTYAGTLPCADCAGIRTELTLNKNETYRLSTTYFGKGTGKSTVSTGRFSWDAAGATVRLIGLSGQPAHYQVGENRVTQLDMQGRRIGGKLAEQYVLRKQ